MRFSTAILSILAASITAAVATPVELDAACTPGERTCMGTSIVDGKVVYTLHVCNVSSEWELTATCGHGQVCEMINGVTYCV